MTNNEITEYLNEEANKLLPGIKVTEILAPERRYRFEYNDTNVVFEPNSIERLSKEDIVKEIIEPTVAKIKVFNNRREGIPEVNISEQREKEIREEVAREFAEIKEKLNRRREGHLLREGVK